MSSSTEERRLADEREFDESYMALLAREMMLYEAEVRQPPALPLHEAERRFEPQDD